MLRREKGCKIDERIEITIPKQFEALPKALIDLVKKETLTENVLWGEKLTIHMPKTIA